MRPALIALVASLFVAPPALATHDAGYSYTVLRFSEDGELALLAKCDMQASEHPVLLVRKVEGRGVVLNQLRVGGALDPALALCEPGQRADKRLEGPDLVPTIKRHALTQRPFRGAWSPARDRYVLMAYRDRVLEVRLLDPPRSTKILAGEGFGPVAVSAGAYWHPQGRAVVVAGQRTTGVTEGVEHHEPIAFGWKLPGPATTAKDVANAWVLWAMPTLQSCMKTGEPHICEAAKRGFDGALAEVPSDRRALEGAAKAAEKMGDTKSAEAYRAKLAP